jgi:DNA-binding NarL/FixJ family response regulator
MKPITVAVVEDREQYQRSIKRAIEAKADVLCIGVFSNAEEALAYFTSEVQPDIILMDIDLPGISGIEAVERLQQTAPQIEIIMLTIYEDNENVFNALRAGAIGYILKTSTPEEIYDAIMELRAGGSPMSDGIARKVTRFFRDHPKNVRDERSSPASAEALLTTREREIVEYLAKGYRYKEIADMMFISQETVRKHIHNTYKKLQVGSRTEAMLKLKR